MDVVDVRFEYPEAYNFQPFASFPCRPRLDRYDTESYTILIGDQVAVSAMDNWDDTTAPEQADLFRDFRTDIRNVVRTTLEIGGEPAVRIQYVAGPNDLTFQIAFVVHGERVYDIYYSGEEICTTLDPLVRIPSEIEVYERILQTIRFED